MSIASFSNTAYVNFGVQTQYRLTNNFTITGFIRPVDASVTNTILSRFRLGVSNDRCYVLRTLSGVASFAISTAGTSASILTANGATSLSANTIYHIAGRINGSAMTVFLNGVPDGSLNTTSSAYNSSVAPLLLGAIDYTVDRQVFTGTLYDVRMYNAALSDGAIAQIANAKGLDNITNNLVFRTCIFDGRVGIGSLSGKTVYDYSTYAQNVTAIGDPSAVYDIYTPYPRGND